MIIPLVTSFRKFWYQSQRKHEGPDTNLGAQEDPKKTAVYLTIQFPTYTQHKSDRASTTALVKVSIAQERLGYSVRISGDICRYGRNVNEVYAHCAAEHHFRDSR